MKRSDWAEIHTRGDTDKHTQRIHAATREPAPMHRGLAPHDPDPCNEKRRVGECRNLERLQWALWVLAEAAQLVEATVYEARTGGRTGQLSWTQVGEVHGMTRQSAQQKFRHLTR